MDLRELRSFVTLVDLGSIAAAARKLNLSPPAIYKQLAGLEVELGVKLYERSGRSLRMTQASEILLPYARDLLAQHDVTLSVLEEWKGVRKGMVRIGAGPTISSYILPPLLRSFRRVYPSVDLYVETGNTKTLVESLTNGSLDLALLVAPQYREEPSISVEAIWSVEFVLVSNLRDVPRRCALQELRKFPFILYKKGSRIANLIEHYFTEASFEPRVIMTFDSAEAIKAMIRTGLGISMLPMWTVDGELKRRTLSVIRQREHPLLSQVELVSRKTSYLPQAVNAFITVAAQFQCRSPRLIYR